MRNAITISLPADVAKKVDAAAKRKGMTRSRYVRVLLERDLFRERLFGARKILVPMAREKGYCTDEDIFKAVS